MHQLEYVELKTSPTPNSSVIWLHGLGADGYDFENIVGALQLPEKLGVHFIFPHAPIQPVSINGGYPMRSWFDILGIDINAAQDEAGIRKSQESIAHLIEEMFRTGIPHERIIVGGFSQGGALALHMALRYPKRLAGAIGLSTFLPLADLLPQERHAVNADLPIFIGHGIQDDVVPLQFGKFSCAFLKGLNYSVTWREYETSHSVNEQEVKDISQWIQQVLS